MPRINGIFGMDFNECARGIVYFLTKSHGSFICVNLFHVASVPPLPTLNVEPIDSSSAVANFPVGEFSFILFTGTHCTCSRRDVVTTEIGMMLSASGQHEMLPLCLHLYLEHGRSVGRHLMAPGFLFGMAEGGNGTAGTCWRRKKSPLRGEPQRGWERGWTPLWVRHA